jgi:Zn finger protein HypA/HybF involved in hydrogenase expression
MIWQSVINAAIFGGIVGAIVTVLLALVVRVKCPHCQKRCKPGMWKRRRICPNCGGPLKKNAAGPTVDK